MDKLSHLIDIHIPLKSVKFNKFKHKANKWMTKGLLKSLKSKEALYIKMLKSRNTPSFIEKETNYKKYKSIYQKCIKSAKKLYWQNRFLETKHDMKKTWQNINFLIHKQHNKSNFPEVFNDNNMNYKSNIEIANGFNNYFTTIGSKLANSITNQNKTAAEFLAKEPLPHSLFLNPAIPQEISNVVNAMHPKTSCGYDNISPKLVKKCSHALVNPLVHIINLSLSTGTFPDKMKLAKVIAIYKSNNPSNFSNYRPISLLPTFSKILERVIYNRLYNFILKHNILNTSQYGFQKGLSTEYALLELQDRIVKSLASKEYCVGFFLDLSKAFDSLDHKILIEKLNHIGIRGIALELFKSYLNARKQYTQFRSAKSHPNLISYGIPQGSILGPLLFLIYINDFPNNLKISKSILFADDTTLLFHDSDSQNLLQTINSELDVACKWFSANKLSLNVAKTKYVIFHSPQKKLPTHLSNIKIGNFSIERADSVKFLGIWVDQNMNWKKHIDTKCSQAVKVAAILSRLKHLLPISILRTIYNSLFLPHLSYGILAWGNVSNSEINRLRKIQKKAIRQICNTTFNSHTEPLFKKLNLLRLDDIFTSACVKLFVKRMENSLPTYLHRQLPTNLTTHDYETRQQGDIHQFAIKTELEKQSLNTKISIVWNDAPNNVRNSRLKSITKIYKRHLLSSYKEFCEIENCRNNCNR